MCARECMSTIQRKPSLYQKFLKRIEICSPKIIKIFSLLFQCTAQPMYSVHWSATCRSRSSITAKTGGWPSPAIHSRRGTVHLLRGSLCWVGRSTRKSPRYRTQPSPSLCPPRVHATIVFLPRSRSSTLLNTEETFNFICRLRRCWRHRI